MQELNRKELEEYIIDLYYNQNKTYRQIQSMTRKSARDIKAILDRVKPNNCISDSVSSKAYQMFEQRTSPTRDLPKS